jgi:hypothetical protein
MAITFDPINKLIKLTAPTTDVSAQQLYNASMDWADELDNMIYDVPMDANGKFALGGGVFSDTIYRLLQDWKLKWWDGDKTVLVAGTIITDDETSRTVAADAGSIETIFQVNTSGTVEISNMILVATVNDTSITGAEFNGDNTLSSIDDFYNGSVLVFTSGQLQGIARQISDYDGTNKTFFFQGNTGDADASFPVPPADADQFKIIGRMA